MNGCILLLAASLVVAADDVGNTGMISGIVVNGTDADAPLAGADVILRASQDGSFLPIDKTTTDSEGRFVFREIPADSKVIYLPGANRGGVHYPGPRVRLGAQHSRANVKLVAYDVIESPCPLVSRRHEFQVRADRGFLEVAETLVLDNPTRTAYVGEQQREGHVPVTLRVSLPSGFETVTFHKEFHARQFQIHDADLITGMPWTPGQHELKFMYRLPIEHRHTVLLRRLSQPSDHVIVRVMATDRGHVNCNLPQVSDAQGGEVIFEHRGDALPAGHAVELSLGALPIRFDAYAPWLALTVLMILVAGSLATARWRSKALADPNAA